MYGYENFKTKKIRVINKYYKNKYFNLFIVCILYFFNIKIVYIWRNTKGA